jgi:hypothetical protein
MQFGRIEVLPKKMKFFFLKSLVSVQAIQSDFMKNGSIGSIVKSVKNLMLLVNKKVRLGQVRID